MTGINFRQKCHSNLLAMLFQDLRGRHVREKSTHYICYGVVAYDKRKRGGRFRFRYGCSKGEQKRTERKGRRIKIREKLKHNGAQCGFGEEHLITRERFP